ncbi:MAG: hypothetical protein FWD29_09475 [Micrococcales bacterium]|nr:hypothetical protein [Micrococcales bacterium]
MNQSRKFHRPAMIDPQEFDQLQGGVDPAASSELAHSSAAALVAQARQAASDDPELVERLVSLVENEGVEPVATLWANAPGDSLPGALWRVYLLREWVRRDPDTVAERYRLGMRRQEVAHVVAGAAQPPGPQEMSQLADSVLSGVFTGELDVALERAAAFARVVSTGAAIDADWIELTRPAAARRVTRRAGSLLGVAEDLEQAAIRWRAGTLA